VTSKNVYKPEKTKKSPILKMELLRVGVKLELVAYAYTEF